MLASLYNIPRDYQGLNQFSFANADHHTQVFNSILSKYSINLTVYLIDPIPLNNLGVWLYNHQQMHDLQNAVLGIAGNDFTDLDFSKPDESANWFYLHAIEHYQAAQALGI